MTPQAYLYICDGDIDHPVLTEKKMDWPEKYPHWQEIPLFMAQRKPLTDEEIYSLADSLEIWNEDDEEWILDPITFARAIEAAHGIKE